MGGCLCSGGSAMHWVCRKGHLHLKEHKVPSLAGGEDELGWAQMIKGVQNRTEQWSKQLLAMRPNKSSSILTGVPCAAPKVRSFLPYRHRTKRGSATPFSCLICVRGARAHSQAAKASGIQGFGCCLFVLLLFHALKCVSSSIRHNAVPLSMKASDTLRWEQYRWLFFRTQAHYNFTFQTTADATS